MPVRAKRACSPTASPGESPTAAPIHPASWPLLLRVKPLPKCGVACEPSESLATTAPATAINRPLARFTRWHSPCCAGEPATHRRKCRPSWATAWRCSTKPWVKTRSVDNLRRCSPKSTGLTPASLRPSATRSKCDALRATCRSNQRVLLRPTTRTNNSNASEGWPT